MAPCVSIGHIEWGGVYNLFRVPYFYPPIYEGSRTLQYAFLTEMPTEVILYYYELRNMF
jgi:hypothetical protein